MSLLHGRALKLEEQRKGLLEATDRGSQLDEGWEGLGVAHGLLELLDHLFRFGSTQVEGVTVELLPGKSGVFLDHSSVLFIDGIDLGVGLVGLLHSDELRELGDVQVEHLLGVHKSVLLGVKAEASSSAVSKGLHTLFKRDVVSTGTVLLVLRVSLFEFDLELSDLVLGDLGVEFFLFADLVILAVGLFDEFSPVFTDLVNFFLILRVDLVAVHAKDSELLLSLSNAELHVHRRVSDLSDHAQHLAD